MTRKRSASMIFLGIVYALCLPTARRRGLHQLDVVSRHLRNHHHPI